MVPTVQLSALALLAVLGLLGAGVPGAAGLALGPPSSPAPYDGHAPRATPLNIQFSEDELTDNRNKTVKLDGPCGDATCSAHCKARAHASGRCDQDGTCVCRDLKQKGRCASLGFGCGGACPDGEECAASSAGRANNIVNNNNILVMH